jgi:hypothetical protein
MFVKRNGFSRSFDKLTGVLVPCEALLAMVTSRGAGSSATISRTGWR